MISTVQTPNIPQPSPGTRLRELLTPINLHLAGVALLVLVNVYLVVQIAVLWQRTRSNDARAIASQQIALKTAEIGAQPLRGLDAKLATATSDADQFYQRRFPAMDSAVLAELGDLTRIHTVRLTRAAYTHAPVLAGTQGELTEMRIDASLSGDYRQLVQFINALERDRMFFVIDAVNLTGQQSGTVNLRLRLRTFLRARVSDDDSQDAQDADQKDAGGTEATTPAAAPPAVAARPVAARPVAARPVAAKQGAAR
jgi:putative Ca2+/H+ antiporter (TMEM165/GDT1 family)